MGFTTGVILEVVELEDNLAAAVEAALALAATRGDGAVVGQGNRLSAGVAGRCGKKHASSIIRGPCQPLTERMRVARAKEA